MQNSNNFLYDIFGVGDNDSPKKEQRLCAENILPMVYNNIVLIAGKSKVGKSSIALKIANEFINQHHKTSITIYLHYDHNLTLDLFKETIREICPENYRYIIPFTPEILKASGGIKNIIKRTIQASKENLNMDIKNFFIVIDPVMNYFAKQKENFNENEYNEVATEYDNYKALISETSQECNVEITSLFLHHLNKNGELRGSSALANFPIAIYELEKVENGVKAKLNSSNIVINFKEKLFSYDTNDKQEALKCEVVLEENEQKNTFDDMVDCDGNLNIQNCMIASVTKASIFFPYSIEENGEFEQLIHSHGEMSLYFSTKSKPLRSIHRKILNALLQDVKLQLVRGENISFNIKTNFYELRKKIGGGANYEQLETYLDELKGYNFNFITKKRGAKHITQSISFFDYRIKHNEKKITLEVSFHTSYIQLYRSEALLNYSQYYELLNQINSSLLNNIIYYLLSDKPISIFSFNSYKENMAISKTEAKRFSELKKDMVELFKEEIIERKPFDIKEIEELKKELKNIDENNTELDELIEEIKIDDILLSKENNNLKDILKNIGVVKVYKINLNARQYDIVFGFVRPKNIKYYAKIKEDELRVFNQEKIIKQKK